jgi:hypothetical protein
VPVEAVSVVVSVAAEAVSVVVSVAAEAVSVVVSVAAEAVSAAPDVVSVALGIWAEALEPKTARRAPTAARVAASRRHLECRPGR